MGYIRESAILYGPTTAEAILWDFPPFHPTLVQQQLRLKGALDHCGCWFTANDRTVTSYPILYVTSYCTGATLISRGYTTWQVCQIKQRPERESANILPNRWVGWGGDPGRRWRLASCCSRVESIGCNDSVSRRRGAWHPDWLPHHGRCSGRVAQVEKSVGAAKPQTASRFSTWATSLFTASKFPNDQWIAAKRFVQHTHESDDLL